MSCQSSDADNNWEFSVSLSATILPESPTSAGLAARPYVELTISCSGTGTDEHSLSFVSSGSGSVSFRDEDGVTISSVSLAPGESDIVRVYGDSVSDSKDGTLIKFFLDPDGEPCDTLQLTVVKVLIKKDGTDITGTTVATIVGKRQNLSAELVPADTSWVLTGKAWTIPPSPLSTTAPDPINDYTPSSSSAAFTTLTPTNLASDSVSFCWLSGATGREVSFALTVNGVALSGKAYFDVARPNPTITPSWGTATKLGNRLVDGSPVFCLHLGEITGTPPMPTSGILFTVTTGADVALGTFDWCQIIRPLEYNKYPVPWVVSTRPNWNQTDPPDIWGSGLDGPFPYGKIPGTVNTSDSPMLGLVGTPLRGGYVGFSYDMFFIFKPPGTDSIWVALKKITWHWTGRATKDLGTGAWSLSDEFPATTSDTLPTVSDWTTPPPMWIRSASGNQFQESPSGPP